MMIIVEIDGALQRSQLFRNAQFDFSALSTFLDVVDFHPHRHGMEYNTTGKNDDETKWKNLVCLV